MRRDAWAHVDAELRKLIEAGVCVACPGCGGHGDLCSQCGSLGVLTRRDEAPSPQLELPLCLTRRTRRASP